MWLKGGRAMGPSALVGIATLVAIEYVASGGQLGPRAAPAADPTFHARLARGPCLGSCPDYSVDIDAAGLVTFVGRKSTIEPSVPCLGTRHGRISAAGVATLETEVDRADPFALKDAYRAAITDQPTFTVTVTRRGRSKTIIDYVGEMVGMPKAVIDLENAIDEAADDRACVVPAKPPT